MNLLDFRARVNNAVSTQLGTYTLPGGATTPAISVREFGESIPAGQKVSGLEVVIIKTPEVKPILTQGQTFVNEEWRVYLVQWPGQHRITAAINAIQEAFPLSNYQELRSLEKGLILAQGVFTIPEPSQSSLSTGPTLDVTGLLTFDGSNPLTLSTPALNDRAIESIVVEILATWSPGTSIIVGDDTVNNLFADGGDSDPLEVGEYQIFVEESLSRNRTLVAAFTGAPTTGSAAITVIFADN